MNDAASTPEAGHLSAPSATAPAHLPARRSRPHIQISLTLGFLMLGVLLALQVNTQRAIHQNSPTGRPDWFYQQLLNEREKKLKALEQEKGELARRVAEFEASSGRASQQSQILKNELESARMLAGMTPVHGPGVVVTVADSPRAIKLAEGFYAGIVHAEDLLRLGNELWNAGAEAVAINGVRLCAGWDIRCAGSIVNVRGQRIASPYKLEAIGDPMVLKSAMLLPDGIVDDLKSLQLKITVTTGKSISLTGAMPDRFKMAHPLARARED